MELKEEAAVTTRDGPTNNQRMTLWIFGIGISGVVFFTLAFLVVSLRSHGSRVK